MLDVFLAALTEYLDSKRDLQSGTIDTKQFAPIKDRLEKSFEKTIQIYMQKHMNAHRRSSSIARFSQAESISLSSRTNASTIRMMSALNSAPPPPDNLSSSDLQLWVKEYRKWHDKDRTNALNNYSED